VLNQITRILKRIAQFSGIDRAIFYTVVGKGFQILAGPITLILIAHYLSPAEQGFYYTFTSVVNLQIFFELGMSFVILQFASHEKAALNWENGRKLEGDSIAKERLASLLRLSIKWYGIIAILAITILTPVGISFLSSNKAAIDVSWQLPWILVVISSGGMLFLSPLLSFLEGCGLVAEIAYMRVAQAVLSSFFLWAALIFNTNLFAAAAPNLIGFIWIGSWLYRKYRYLFVDLLDHRKYQPGIERKVKSISWRHEIFPLQWRIALSWLSGYFIFSLFTPILFMFHGPVVAGKMGMSLSLSSAITGLALSWISTKSSPFGSLIAAKKYNELDRLFFPALWQSTGVAILGGTVLCGIVFVLDYIHHPFSSRVVDLLPLALLSLSSICNVYISGLAIYLRAHKKEPFLSVSIIGGILTGISTYFLGRDYGIIGMSTGYCLLNLTFGVISGTWIFISKRKQWHSSRV
jgi:hypothetical protein